MVRTVKLRIEMPGDACADVETVFRVALEQRLGSPTVRIVECEADFLIAGKRVSK